MNDKNLKIKGLSIVSLLVNHRNNYMIFGNGDDRRIHYDPDQYDVEIEMDPKEFFQLVIDQIKSDQLLFLELLKTFMTGGSNGSPEKKSKKNQCTRLYAKKAAQH